MPLTKSQVIAQVDEIRQLHAEKGIQPIYEIDARQYNHGWTRETGDLILAGISFGKKSLSFVRGLEKLED